MYKILRREDLASQVVLMEIEAPMVAQKCLPGQFIILRSDEKGERIPLTIADYDRERGSVTIIFQVVGKTTRHLAEFTQGQEIADFVGPLGLPSHTEGLGRVAVIGGGLGCAIAYPQAKAIHQAGGKVDIIAGFRNSEFVILEKEMHAACDNLYILTDDGSYGEKALVTHKLEELLASGEQYDHVIAIGPLVMMKFVCQLTKQHNIKTMVSLNPIMIDGTGMCGGCRVSVGGQVKFACVDGPDFDGHEVDFDEAIRRSRMYTQQEHQSLEEHTCKLEGMHRPKPERNMSLKKVPMPEQPPEQRCHNFQEVTTGYTPEMALEEAARCLGCKHRPCVAGCPVKVQIPEFIELVQAGEFAQAYHKIRETNSLPAICGRVCPQEVQCEAKCVRGIKGEPVAIGRLERFCADWFMENGSEKITPAPSNGHKVAVLGGGPAGLTCAGDLLALGYEVTLFEAFHQAGGVLVYGIPEFRLPKDIVAQEIEKLQAAGLRLETNVVAGRAITLDELKQKGFEAVFIGTGAGLPTFMGIEGENLNGVFSANEYLTRINLMKAYIDEYDTPIMKARKVAVVGGGNVAMDAARSARRMGAQVYIVYRRGEEEMPARLEEVHHAREEGVEFRLLCNPVRVLGNEEGWVTGLECVEMQLGEPDASGRRRPVEKAGSNFVLDVDCVIMAIGTSPNPILKNSTPALETNRWGCIVADETTGKTSLPGVYAGGDAVTGAATVILAMGAGKEAAAAIDEQLQGRA